jgi:hypothetical protein
MNTIINCVKKFYSVRLKEYRESVPVSVAQQMLKEESELIQYLCDNGALEFRFVESRHRLDLYADDKYLTMGRIKYPNIFGDRGKMGFMELYINRLINKKLQLAKGST